MSRYKNYLMLSVATVAAIVMRTVMAFFIIDQNSGFVNNENMAYAVFIIVIILAAAAVVYLQALTSPLEKLKAPDFAGVFRIIISILLALAIAFDVSVNQTSYLLPLWMTRAYTVISVIFMAYLMFSAFKRETPPLLSVIPVIFWLLRLVMAFLEFSSVSNTVENLLELLTICIILLFFLTYGKAICLEPVVKLLRKLNALTYLACYMAFVTAIPKAVIVFSGYENILHENNRSFIVTLLTGFYILLFIFKNNKKSRFF